MSNPATRTAPILKIEGPPGSGKTRELAREACRLVVEEGIPPEKILLLAVTAPLKKRLESFLKEEARLAGLDDLQVEVSTWEDFMVRVLQGPNLSEETEVSVLEDSDAQILLHRILREAIGPGHLFFQASQQLSFSRMLLDFIRQLQLHQLTPDALTEIVGNNDKADSRLPLLAEIYRRFIEQTSARRLLCLADLMNQASRQVLESAPVRQWLGEKYAVIMSDDAQELSEGQHRLLASLPVRLVLAGNEKFSIRRFRGALPAAFATLSGYGERPVTFQPRLVCMRGNEAILSLLNTFLPEPIWEERATDTDRLQSAVQFGFYPDPMLEAEGVVAILNRLNRSERLSDSEGERSIQWEDCVILLRTSHYKPHLINALVQAGIPFRSEIFTEHLIRFQHLLFDLLCVLDSLQTLHIRPDRLSDSGYIQQCLGDWVMPAGEKAAWIRKANRHLSRFLEAAFPDDQVATALSHLSASLLEDGGAEGLLLAALAELPDSSPLAPARPLIRQYQALALPEMFEQVSVRFLESLEPDALKEIQQGHIRFYNNLQRLDGHYRASFGHALPIDALLRAYPSLWDGVETPSPMNSAGGGRVAIRSLHQMQGLEAPFVFIPFLVDAEFPLNRETPELLSESDGNLLAADFSYKIDEAEEARLLAMGMSRARQRVVLSCHRANSGMPVLPSPFYTRLLEGKRQLLGQPVLGRICRCENPSAGETGSCEVDYCSRTALESAETEDFFARYTGDSLWANLARETSERLFNPSETVYLSASSIKTYMACPRQFFYQHLLKLRQPGSEAATLGSLTHRLMEVFNRRLPQAEYTAQELRRLAAVMFAFDSDEEAFLVNGFEEQDRLVLARLSPLTLANLKHRLMEAVDDLEQKGYFQRYGNLKAVEAEKRLESFALEGIEGCRFNGIIDALIQADDGRWDIVDYKTFRTAYGTGLDTCDRHFRSALDPLPDDDGLTHSERFWSKLSDAYPKDYQLPLYYLACSQDPAYRDKLRSVALQVIRPAFPDNENQGAIRLEMPGHEIEARKQQMLADINRYIVQPIRGSEAFEASPDRSTCGRCGYFGICEASGEADSGEGEA
jgi:superfamily I DNA/RNA helicase